MKKVEYQEPVTKYEIGRWGVEKLEVYAETPKTFWIKGFRGLRRHAIIRERTFDTLREARVGYIELLKLRIERRKKSVVSEEKALADYLVKIEAEA